MARTLGGPGQLTPAHGTSDQRNVACVLGDIPKPPDPGACRSVEALSEPGSGTTTVT